MIRVSHLNKSYNHPDLILKDISFEVKRGEFVYLVGPSGAGKTTLFRLLFADLKPDSGQVVVDGLDLMQARPARIAKLRRRMGMVFQDYKLIPNYTVFDNVALALEVAGTPRKLIQKAVWQVLKVVGIERQLERLPPQLSGGEQQRVAIARALVNDPQIILADEPTGNLDYEITEEIMNIFKYINSQGATVVMVTHNRALLQRFKRKVFYLDKGSLQTYVWPD
ncbi:MAG: cell division ATP-binding protein FtsE [Deltaproteobacteria bacterium]|nr:cell division ATP-binding protein FtsE [Deltaproteobacteria bacterium]